MIPADVSNISPIVEQVMELAQEMDCTTGKEFEIETALCEALANALCMDANRTQARIYSCVSDAINRGECELLNTTG
jgi:anti-sigma regulatory factor (Ser/Thr protein kinase)